MLKIRKINVATETMRPRHLSRSNLVIAQLLYEAVEDENIRDVLSLLERDKADPNFVLPEKGISPFHLVIGSESTKFAEEATRIFLQFDANPNVRSEDGLTPLHVAAVWGRAVLLLLLLSCGGDPWLRDSENDQTPLHLALKEKHWETALILQRHQLLDKRSRRSGALSTHRFNISLEKIVVSAGEMQAEYGIGRQDNISPVLMSPIQESKRLNGTSGWNIEPVETQDYVRQWCNKEFSFQPVTSTPTQCVPPQSRHGVDNAAHPTTPLRLPTPPNCGIHRNAPNQQVKDCSPAKGLQVISSENSCLKSSTDVRKNLFLELKKRFNGLKQSFENSRDDSDTKNEFGRRGKLGYFSRRKKEVDKTMNCRDSVDLTCKEANESNTSDHVKMDTSLTSVNLSPRHIDDNLSAGSELKFLSESLPVDEVDAVPLSDQCGTSIEWIASQSCFLGQSSPESTNSQLYFTCDEGSVTDVNALERRALALASVPSSNIPVTISPVTPPEEPTFKAPQRPPRRKQLIRTTGNISTAKTVSDNPSGSTFGSIISEDYRYTDEEEGVVLLEKRLFTTPLEVPSPSDCESVVSIPRSGVSDSATAISEVSSVPASFCYDTETLRKELIAHGEVVGPIISSTKRVYLRRLYRLQKNRALHVPSSVPSYSPELQKVLNGVNWEAEVITYASLEAEMCAPFEKPDPNRRWREGVTKSSFNYLLLDPRVSQNLPATVTAYDLSTWHKFLSSIFYVGKGKRSRPYAHLYQAVRVWNKGMVPDNTNAKIKRILDIWRDGHGVVCLHVYQNIIPVEAFTREASMLEALGLNNLMNIKSGEYYGPAATWRVRQKRRLGAFLLYRAMRIFLSEGERQLRPGDID